MPRLFGDKMRHANPPPALSPIRPVNFMVPIASQVDPEPNFGPKKDPGTVGAPPRHPPFRRAKPPNAPQPWLMKSGGRVDKVPPPRLAFGSRAAPGLPALPLYTCSAPQPASASLMLAGGSMEGMNSRTA